MGETSQDIRKKRLHFRAWHRGSREMDIILGRYADRHLASMSKSELDSFERILGAPDPDLFAWVTGRVPPPPDLDHALLRRISEDGRR